MVYYKNKAMEIKVLLREALLRPENSPELLKDAISKCDEMQGYCSKTSWSPAGDKEC